jgi:hypothetical protein
LKKYTIDAIFYDIVPRIVVMGIVNRISIDYIEMTYIPKWLAIVDKVKTEILSLNEDIFIPEG